MSRLALLSLLLAVPAVVACNTDKTPATNDGTSTVSGTIALSAYSGLDNPVVIGRSASGRVFVAPVLRTGAFQVSLPTNDSYRFVLASTRADRSYVGVSELHWAGGVVWGKPGKSTMNLGTVRPVGSMASAVSGVSTQDHGGSSGSGGSSGGGGGSSSGGGGGTDPAASGNTPPDGANAGSASTCKLPGEAKLPYDVKPQLGQTFRLVDAFLLEGPAPASIVKVTMDNPSYHLAELEANAPFVITQADCDHQGNRDVGRDRIFVTWTNAGGGSQTDHLDIRYCEAGNRVPDDAAAAAVASVPASGECPSSDTPLCRDDSNAMPESECTGDKLDADDSDHSNASGVSPADHGGGGGGNCDDDIPVCPAGSGAGGTGGSGATGGAAGGATGGAAGGAAGGATGGTAGSAGGATGGAAGAGAGGATGAAGGASSGNVPGGGGCVVTADCQAGLACFNSTCVIPIK